MLSIYEAIIEARFDADFIVQEKADEAEKDLDEDVHVYVEQLFIDEDKTLFAPSQIKRFDNEDEAQEYINLNKNSFLRNDKENAYQEYLDQKNY